MELLANAMFSVHTIQKQYDTPMQKITYIPCVLTMHMVRTRLGAISNLFRTILLQQLFKALTHMLESIILAKIKKVKPVQREEQTGGGGSLSRGQATSSQTSFCGVLHCSDTPAKRGRRPAKNLFSGVGLAGRPLIQLQQTRSHQMEIHNQQRVQKTQLSLLNYGHLIFFITAKLRLEASGMLIGPQVGGWTSKE